MSTDVVRIVAPPGDPMRNARIFRAWSGGLLAHHRGTWYAYTERSWTRLPDDELDRRIRLFFDGSVYETQEGLIPFVVTNARVKELTAAIRALTLIPERLTPPVELAPKQLLPLKAYPTDPLPGELSDYIALQNGLLHVPSRTLQEHRPTFFAHHFCDFDYDPEAPAPAAWMGFLWSQWEEGSPEIDALQEWFGYVLTADTSHQKIAVLVGPKRSGKGTIARVLRGLLGKPHVAGMTGAAALAQNFGLQDLLDKALLIVTDPSFRVNSPIAVERLKSVSGEDAITVDRKYRDPVTVTLPTRIMILTNEEPKFYDPSGALAARLVPVRLTQSFVGREDRNLTEKLLAERAGILNWALEGLDRLRERGHFEVPPSGREIAEDIERLSSPVGAFVEERCEVGPERWSTIEELHSAYLVWCAVQGVRLGDRLDRQNFGREFRSVVAEHGITADRSQIDGVRTTRYFGVGLR